MTFFTFNNTFPTTVFNQYHIKRHCTMNKRFVLSILPICAAAILSAQPIWQIDFKNLTDDVKKTIQLKGVSEITPEGLVTESSRTSRTPSLLFSRRSKKFPMVSTARCYA